MSLLWFLPKPVREPARFEIRALIGRALTRSIPTEALKNKYLNLGSGSVCFDDYVNVDFFVPPGGKKPHGSYYGADLRCPLRIESGIVGGIFSEHAVEHLTYGQAAQLFSESFRILRPGGRLRIIVPDLSLFIRAYCASDTLWFDEWERLYFTESEDAERRKRRLTTPLEAISFVTQEYGHVSSWDFDTMKAALSRAGFAGIEKCSYRQGSDERLLRDMDAPDRRFVSLFVEAVKPLR